MIDKDNLKKEVKSELHKERVYIEDPAQAPEWANVQEGDQGGLYYETDDEEAIVGEMEDKVQDKIEELGEQEAIEAVNEAGNELALEIGVDGTQIVPDGAEDLGAEFDAVDVLEGIVENMAELDLDEETVLDGIETFMEEIDRPMESQGAEGDVRPSERPGGGGGGGPPEGAEGGGAEGPPGGGGGGGEPRGGR